MTKGKEQKKGKHGEKTHHVVVQGPGKKTANDQHRKAMDPVLLPTGELASHVNVTLSENLTIKDRHVIEKLEAMIEYEEAHDRPVDAQKIRERIEVINIKADAKHKQEHDAPITVIHSGGHKHKKEHHE